MRLIQSDNDDCFLLKRYICTLLNCFLWVVMLPLCSRAQQDTASIFSQPVQLDSFVLKSNFDVNAFIRRIRTDTTFYKAFKHMRLVPYIAVNTMKACDKNGAETASWKSRTAQEIDKGCRITKILQEQATGDFYKRNGDYNYYTAKLFAHIFFAREPVCNETDIVAGDMDTRSKGQLEKSEYQLKQLIFNPGSKVSGVPFMGARESIFEPGEAEKYLFKIERRQYEGQQCYVFSITPKPGYEHSCLYNALITWFRQNDYSIVARDYSLSYSNMLYDFDVHMIVRTQQVGGKLYPVFISYDGNWHVVTKKRERVKFTSNISY